MRAVPYDFARHIIERYEWLGTMSKTTHHFGIFFGLYCGGVVCYSASVASGGYRVPMTFGVAQREMATLARGACLHWTPTGAASKLISISVRLLPPEIKVVIAYADSDAGEIGTVYQASNWLYIGPGDSVLQFVAPNGHIYDQKLLHDYRIRQRATRTTSRDAFRRQLKAAGWIEQRSNPKHRYVVIRNDPDHAIRTKIEPLIQPYPRRKHSSDALGDQPREGVAESTSTLHGTRAIDVTVRSSRSTLTKA